MAEFELEIGQYSETGRKKENQDSFGVLIPDEPEISYKGIAAVIADGVSGCENGKMASESCVKSLLHDYYATPDSWSVKRSVEKVLLATNRWLHGQGSQPGTLASTLSALIVKSNTGHLFHIGDSRIWRLRGGRLEQLTQDHSWGSGGNQYLSRAMGIDLRLDIDYRTLPVEPGDIFIFTSDGVHEYVSTETIADTVQNRDTLNQAAETLVRAAWEAGSPDNLTCQIVRFINLPVPSEQEVLLKLSELPFPPLLEAGMKLDGYRIVREISASKRVQIYQAIDEENGQPVVLKTPSPNFEDDPIYIDLFSHEEWVGSRISSPHVMRVFKPRRKRSFLYLVSEYIEGETLRQWMDEHPQRSFQQVRDLINQAARGLMAFHRLEMLHQDLKPDNIMIGPDGILKLIDFGSVKIAGLEEISSPLERIHLLGTKHYAAPEYFLGYAGSQRSDQFSLAVIAFELLTGHLPYGEKYGEGNVVRIKYTSARHWNPEIPLWMDRALEKALSVDPDKRYETLTEFLHDLEKPNPRFLQQDRQPLIERNPVAFWRTCALISLGINLLLMIRMLL
ncbi:MAG TPA: bifunctional protein-serine/threonine kinase/phosphatase [Methylothermaceae bacterium]|nr:bifunctional protein-serine/threonine kinase/phosphatase [Methylothermaceae bacterium]